MRRWLIQSLGDGVQPYREIDQLWGFKLVRSILREGPSCFAERFRRIASKISGCVIHKRSSECE